MRPVRRGVSPISGDFGDFKDAKADLVSRMGSYCSYCERHIATQLAVEHIQPKGRAEYAHLAGLWENFLLACVNCNSTKRDKDVVLSQVLLPDRDNTFAAFVYSKDGKVQVDESLTPEMRDAANATIKLVGLDRRISEVRDANGKLIALDRAAQRMEVWLLAEESKSELDKSSGNQELRRATARIAQYSGFFSIWMAVFEEDQDMRRRLIETFESTMESGCFDPETAAMVTPAPNPDGLEAGGKV